MEKSGFLLINKPKNISSYDCIRHLKRIIKRKIKIGHAGTLDNFATGLLIIGIGRKATKNMDIFLNSDKEYFVTGKFGVLTDTLDITGEILKEKSKIILINELKETIKNFPNKYIQVPPIYSALKFKGKSLYKLAREKKISEKDLEKIIQTKKREVYIYKLNLINYNFPFFSLKTKVSKGTYIRSLVNDIAKELNTFATCSELKRTKIGNLSLSNSIKLNSIKTLKDIENKLISIEALKKQFD
ncbi:tRNA pseudouridine(55) synthase TruB [Candidatus Dependentiae bacterium]|nr:tRNA pseudouridine(55) synthase TruB [Candidatus Dependentiae bacterium]